MNTTVKLDRAGRIVIPEAVRDELHPETGDALSLASQGDRVTLRLVRSVSLRKEQGVWVFAFDKSSSSERAGATHPKPSWTTHTVSKVSRICGIMGAW